MKKRMAIVSSYSESCGNAAFTKVLKNSIEQNFSDCTVDVMELDLVLLQSIERHARKKADKHILAICDLMKDYDQVNIQMEAGLYGTLPHDITRRLKWLVQANKNTTITLHSPRLVQNGQSSSRSALKKIIQLKLVSGLKELIASTYSNIHVSINHKILQIAAKEKSRLIVHTPRAKKQIEIYFDYKNVTLHPLKFVSDNYQPSREFYNLLRSQLPLDPDDILIGLFGYISQYKGHEDALKALERLPNHFKILIAGRQHPQTIKQDGKADAYLERLVKYIDKSTNLKGRVLFLGEFSDEDFVSLASNVDVTWLPYYENGQDGSGIASICLDVSPRVICSTSFAFDELFKQVKYKNVLRFDIGNTNELALKTTIILKSPPPDRPYADSNQYSISSQAIAYMN
jgi:glycosyltransferase involved in cell wall biosynthesis